MAMRGPPRHAHHFARRSQTLCKDADAIRSHGSYSTLQGQRCEMLCGSPSRDSSADVMVSPAAQCVHEASVDPLTACGRV